MGGVVIVFHRAESACGLRLSTIGEPNQSFSTSVASGNANDCRQPFCVSCDQAEENPRAQAQIDRATLPARGDPATLTLAQPLFVCCPSSILQLSTCFLKKYGRQFRLDPLRNGESPVILK